MASKSDKIKKTTPKPSGDKAGKTSSSKAKKQVEEDDELEDDDEDVKPSKAAKSGPKTKKESEDDDDDEDGRKVDDPAKLWPLSQTHWEIEIFLKQGRCIARPADRNRADHQRIFEDQRDPDHPGDQFAEHRIGISVGAARRGDHRRNFRIGKRSAGADHAGNGEGENDGRTGLAGTHADQGENARADDRTDTQCDKVRPAQ